MKSCLVSRIPPQRNQTVEIIPIIPGTISEVMKNWIDHQLSGHG